METKNQVPALQPIPSHPIPTASSHPRLIEGTTVRFDGFSPGQVIQRGYIVDIPGHEPFKLFTGGTTVFGMNKPWEGLSAIVATPGGMSWNIANLGEHYNYAELHVTNFFGTRLWDVRATSGRSWTFEVPRGSYRLEIDHAQNGSEPLGSLAIQTSEACYYAVNSLILDIRTSP